MWKDALVILARTCLMQLSLLMLTFQTLPLFIPMVHYILFQTHLLLLPQISNLLLPVMEKPTSCSMLSMLPHGRRPVLCHVFHKPHYAIASVYCLYKMYVCASQMCQGLVTKPTPYIAYLCCSHRNRWRQRLYVPVLCFAACMFTSVCQMMYKHFRDSCIHRSDSVENRTFEHCLELEFM